MKLVLLVIIILLTSCGKKTGVEASKIEIQRQYFNAMRNFDEGNYSVSLRLFEDFSKQNSLHKLARNSLQMEILLNFLNEKYEMTDALADMYLKFYTLDLEGCEYAEYMKTVAKSKVVKNDKVSYEDAKYLEKMINDFQRKYKSKTYDDQVFDKILLNKAFICKSGTAIADRYYDGNNFLAAMKKYEEISEYCQENSKIKEKIEVIQNIIIGGKQKKS